LKAFDFLTTQYGAGDKVDLYHLRSLRDLREHELCYIRCQSFLNKRFDEDSFIRYASQRSSIVYLSVPLEEFDIHHPDFKNNINLFRDYPTNGLSVRVKVNVDKFAIHSGFGQIHAGDLDILETYLQLSEALPEKEITFEFELEDSDLRVLGQTIVGLYQKGMTWCTLSPKVEPSNKAMIKALSDLFEFLRYRRCTYLNVYFSMWKECAREWSLKTSNTFSGLHDVHIDLTNRCTHSCSFCGLYGEAAIDHMKKRHNGKIPKMTTDFMRQEIDGDRALKIIHTLPWTVKIVQFGGLGDPLIHARAVECIEAARQRGFNIECLSNMEYLTNKQIETLHQLADHGRGVHFIANVSGGDEETYLRTRPRQKAQVYHRVVEVLKRFTELREAAKGRGVTFTLMCVVNKDNYQDLMNVAKLAIEVGARRIWFKPMEIHGEAHQQMIFNEEQKHELAHSLKSVMDFLENQNIESFADDINTKIVEDYIGV
jgi:MoaA/NifB/PqqE/SkfB family radical SAM enzyme